MCSLSETMSSMCWTAWETMKSRVGCCRIWEMCGVGNNPGGTDPVSRPYFSRGKGPKFFLFFIIISTYNCYICVLLMKTNLMIYICYIFCEGWVEICVLTVRDNEHHSEHAVGDDEVATSDVAGEGGRALGTT